jgi:selenocysteine lyase/cysteine desulfurase
MEASELREKLNLIREGIIGLNRALDGPFGPRRVTYADYTASGRSLAFIEDFIRDEVLPLYANTHSETSATGLQTTRFREDARQAVHAGVGAGPDDVVLFAGAGATGAIQKLIEILNLRIPADLDARHGLSRAIPHEQRPVVFIGPYEHHSNEISWRETIADVVVIAENPDGQIDLEHLDRELETHAARPLRIGTFSAASNVTGIVSDTAAITRTLHRHGALAFWDFAAAAPYVRIDMNPTVDGVADAELAMDAVFLSPHKFIGGPGTPGVLAVKRHLLTNRVPTVPGGGTVAYVSADDHAYLTEPTLREEGGTPAIIESIRAGLVFKLKAWVGETSIEALERNVVRRAIESWSCDPNLKVLGNLDADRLSIVSFLVRAGDRYLHHGFVVALLNDLFGIQARGGCSCAGPYGHRLLGIDSERSGRFRRAIDSGCEGVKPGWVRVNFNYFCPDEVVEFILEAVHFIAAHGWRFLEQYEFEVDTGLWRHQSATAGRLVGLDDVRFGAQGCTAPSQKLEAGQEVLAGYLEDAVRRVEAWSSSSSNSVRHQSLGPDVEPLRWFLMPGERPA